MRVRIHIHIRIQLVWYGTVCPGLVVSLAAVCFTGFNPKIKRELSIKICDPFRREVAPSTARRRLLFQDKNFMCVGKTHGKRAKDRKCGGWVGAKVHREKRKGVLRGK